MNLHSPVRVTGICRLGSVKARKLAMLMAAMAASSQLVPTPVVAQSTATGSLHGRVLNAANGMYLNNARVTVEGTSLETFTNEFGDYTLNNVPAGSATIRVTYTGQEPQTATVLVEAGKPTSQNISFNAGQASVDDEGMIVLNEFVVASERFKNAQEFATNEERYSTNIKSVVATDSLGFVPGGNVGEFVKFLPGIQVNYGGDNKVDPSTASSVQVRGFGADQTSIMIDGIPVSSASPGSLTRTTGLDTLSINNASRIEVVKVSTPDMPSESPGGSVNLITKSAFEYAKPTTTVSLFLTTNTEDMELSKQPGPTDKKSFHTLPSGRISVAIPFSETLGVTVSINSDNKYSPNTGAKTVWQRNPTTVDLRPIGGANGTPVTDSQGRTASLANPYMSSFQPQEFAWLNYSQSGNIKVDWKPIQGLLINGNVNYSRYTGYSTAHDLSFNANSPIDWGSDYTIGRPWQVRTTGSSDLNPGNSAQVKTTSFDKIGETVAGYVTASYKIGPLAFDGTFSNTTSKLRYADLNNDHFSEVEMTLTDIGQVRFDGVAEGIPARVTVLNRAGETLDYSKLENWGASTINGKTADSNARDVENLYRLNARYQLDFLPFDLAVKTGFQRREKDQKKWGKGTGYTFRYVGPDLTPAEVATKLLDTNNNRPIGYGLPQQQWASVYSLYNLYKENPAWFDPNADIPLQASNYKSEANNTKNIKETNDSYYGMIESKLFNNRLNLIAGARKTSRKREGTMALADSKWNYVKNPDGSVYRDEYYRVGVKIDYSNAQRWDPVTGQQEVYIDPNTGTSTTTIPRFAYTEDSLLMDRLAAAGAIHPGHVLYGPNNDSGQPTQANSSNNLEGAKLSLLGNQDIYAKSNDPAIPQVQASYKITDSLTFKTAWTRAVALPDLEGAAGILSNQGQFSINEEADPITAGRAGVVTLSNANLKPQKTTSWDFELSYYFNSGGKLSVSYYYKDIENVWERVTVPSGSPDYALLLDSIGLNAADFTNWVVTSTVNGPASSKNTGYEVDIRQNLGFLGKIGSHFDMFATYSHKDTKRSSESSDVYQILANSADDTYSGGLMFSTSRFSIAARGVYVAENFTRAGTIRYPAVIGPQIQVYNYTPEMFKVNLQANYLLSKRYSLFISANDILNSDRETQYIDAAYLTPSYSSMTDRRTVGVQITAGIDAKF